MLKISTIWLFAIILSLSCSSVYAKDLSRKEALKILQNVVLNQHQTSIYMKSVNEFSLSVGEQVAEYIPAFIVKWSNEHDSYYGKLQENGFITFNKHEKRNSKYGETYVKLTYLAYPTDNLRPLITSSNGEQLNAIVAEVKVDKITGITTHNANNASVEITTKCIPNKLANVFPLSARDLQNGIGSVNFRRYDDGWRLVR